MARGEEERADLEWIETLRPAESADDDLVEQEPRPKEESAVDRAGFSTMMDEVAGLAGDSPLVLARAAPDEVQPELLRDARFEPGDETLLYASEAQAA